MTHGESATAIGSPQAGVAVADAAEGEVQGVGVGRESAGLGDVDDLLLEQLGQVLVEALAAGLAVADSAFELVELAVHDVLPHERGGDHQLDDGNAPLALAPFGEALAADGDEVHAELR